MSASADPSGPVTVRLTDYSVTEIFGDTPDPFGVGAVGMTWRPKDEHFGVRWDGRLVAHAGLVDLPLTAGGVRMDVAGLGGVAVAPGMRGRGLARRVVSAAMDDARSRGFSFGLLFCLPDRVGLYERLGWHPVADEVEVEQPDGPRVMPLRTLWTGLRAGAAWPPGPVRLHSLPM
ncbi:MULTISPECIES: GNAT family N-acetyltransferase [Streptomyces]|uniref:GNAT family N-acetyltransferase n=1 Tax=Streptomyces TaxID=1883 RepID=UPI00163C4750|nr:MULTISPECIES: GNAT family N-acetyltransferase [Streptomyces]MBC2878302.1 GNAT family N-acetyltransferase [Streptomyces sp. TYQ1024]UBI40582.1 GNAT family N-acetyltransferase [Streptomyces mobaraensis]UKW33163.1 GNAT family N-acetyltransferase [Streptomyces sp. TYQ1024]